MWNNPPRSHTLPRLFAHLALPIAALALAAMTACADPPEPDAGEAMESAGTQEPAEAATDQTPEAGDVASVEGDAEHSEGGEGGEHDEGGEHEGDGEHGEHGEGGEHGEEGEESGEYVDRAQRWDATRRGMRLRLSFDESRGAFTGSVENTTQATICNVRVEIHLSNGTELGPTPGTDLAPGASTATDLSAEGHDFERWTAHPESSPCG